MPPTITATQLTDLQNRLAFQDHTIEQLNQTVTRHALEIARLHEQIRLLALKINVLQPSPLASLMEETPPPHY